METIHDEFKEFEKYQSTTYNGDCRTFKSSDDCSNIPAKGNVKARMRMRASFKSDAIGQHTRWRNSFNQVTREPEGKSNPRKAFIKGKSEEIDCDFPSSDDVSTDDDDPDDAFRAQRKNIDHTTASARGGPPRQVYPCKSPSPQAHHRSKSCRVRSDRPRDEQFRRAEERMRRTHSVPSRQRRVSLVEEEESDDSDSFYLVRTFSTSAKGITNRGDSFKKKPLSAQSSSDGSKSEISKMRTLSTVSGDSSYGSVDDPSVQAEPYTVLVMGNSGVGKTTLIQQFMSSEYMGNTEHIEQGTLPCVSVMLDDFESTLEFADILDAEDLTSDCAADAFVVTFAVTDRDSYDDAIMCLHKLRQKCLLERSATILVANKGDIVRGREVEEDEAKVMAVRYGCKYIEVSAIINMKVDELLAGILKQIRMKNLGKEKPKTNISCLPHDGGCILQPKHIVKKIFGKHHVEFGTCDNLLVL